MTVNLFIKYTFLIVVAFIQSREYSQATVLSDTALSRKYMLSGIANYKSKYYDLSIEDFDKAIKENPKNWEAYRYKATAERKLKRFEESIKDYTTALSINKNDVESYKGRADAKRLNDMFEEAIQDYNIAIERDAQDAVMYFGRGYCYYRLNDYQKSIADYTRAIEVSPRSAMYYERRGISYFDYAENSSQNEEDYRKVINDYNKYLDLKGSNPYGAYYYRGISYINIGQLDSGITDLQNYVKLPINADDPIVYRYLGIAYREKRDSVNSRKNFELSIKYDPHPETYIQWGMAEVEFEHYIRALELINAGLEKAKGTIPKECYYYRALAEKYLGDTTKAIADFQKVIEIDPMDKDAYFERITMLWYDLKYEDLFEKDLTAIITNKLIKDSAELACLYYKRSEILHSYDIPEARLDIAEAIKLDPTERVYYLSSASYRYPGDTINIFQDLNKAIALVPNDWRTYLIKAIVYSKIREYMKGCETLHKAKALGAKVSKPLENFICEGKQPKEKDSDKMKLGFIIFPKVMQRWIVNPSLIK